MDNCHAKWLKEVVVALRSEGFQSWANTCERAAAEIESLQAHRERLLELHLQSQAGAGGEVESACQHDLLKPEATVKITDKGTRATCSECRQVWAMPEWYSQSERVPLANYPTSDTATEPK
jgi:hypothetical protein